MGGIGPVIKELREQRGLTQGELALYAGVSSSYVSQIETGQRPNPSAEILYKLAERLGVSVDHIIRRSMGQTPREDPLVEEARHLFQQLSPQRQHEEIERLRIAVRYQEAEEGELTKEWIRRIRAEKTQEEADELIAELMELRAKLRGKRRGGGEKTA